MLEYVKLDLSPKGFHALREEFIPIGVGVGNVYDKEVHFLR